MKILTYLKTFLAISFVFFIIYIFAFRMDGEMGAVLIAFAFIAPLVSVFLAYYSKNKIEISIDCDNYVTKGKDLTIKINVEVLSKIALSFLDFTIIHSDVFNDKHRTFRMSAFKSTSFEYTVSTDVAGNGSIKLVDLYSCGFLGFIRFKINSEIPIKFVGVIPELPDISFNSELFRAVNDIVTTSDEEEEISALSFSANSFPGYEHRDYQLGDPPKKVNWKLSSKRKKLLVRLDETTSSVQPSIVIDLARINSSDVLDEEKIICSAFGTLKLFIQNGIACKVFFKNVNDKISEHLVDSEVSLNQLLLNLILIPLNSISPIKIEELSKACAYLIFLPKLSQDIVSSNFVRSNPDFIHFIVSNENSESFGFKNVWFLNDNNEFKLI